MNIIFGIAIWLTLIGLVCSFFRGAFKDEQTRQNSE